MKLAERVRVLQELLDKQKRADETNADVKTLEDARRGLATAREGLLVEANFLHVLSARVEAAPLPLAPLEGAREKLRLVKERFTQSPTSIKSGRDYNSLLKAAEDVQAKLRESTNAAWKSFVEGRKPTVTREELDRYRTSSRYAVLVRNIEALKLQAANVSKPRTPEELERAVRLFDQLRAEIAKLPQMPVNDPEVARFIDAARSVEGASLDLLTAHVVKFLKDNGLDNDFRVRGR